MLIRILAPTGSGKTVLFELAMIRTLEKGLQFGKPAKCIYIAPTKVCGFICLLQVTSALPLAGIMYGKISRLEYEIRTTWVQM